MNWFPPTPRVMPPMGANNYRHNMNLVAASLGMGTGDYKNIAVHMDPEPHNRHDKNAVRFSWEGRTVGYVPAEDAIHYQPLLLALEKRGFQVMAVMDLRISNRGSVFIHRVHTPALSALTINNAKEQLGQDSPSKYLPKNHRTADLPENVAGYWPTRPNNEPIITVQDVKFLGVMQNEKKTAIYSRNGKKLFLHNSDRAKGAKGFRQSSYLSLLWWLVISIFCFAIPGIGPVLTLFLIIWASYAFRSRRRKARLLDLEREVDASLRQATGDGFLDPSQR